MSIVVWGEFLWDLYPDEPRLGGAPANVAFHLSQLKTNVTLISRVGDDVRGHKGIELLAKAGVDTSNIQIDPTKETGIVEVKIQDQEPTYTLYQDRAWEYIQIEEVDKNVLEESTVFCFGTLSQRLDEGRRSLEKAIDFLPKQSYRIYDPNLRPKNCDFEGVARSLPWANVIKMNNKEAAQIANHFREKDILSWLFNVHKFKIVAITEGHKGCCIYTPTEQIRASAPSTKSHGPHKNSDSVGAGDSFNAYLAFGLLHNLPLSTIAANANYYASYIASRSGATPIIPKEVFDQLQIPSENDKRE